MKKARLIYNPTSGREEVRRRIGDILEKLERMGYETSTYATQKAGDAATEAKRACRHSYDLIVAAGGDGTLNEVITGMAEEENRPTLGILPVGTTNDFARAMGIPRDITKALNLLEAGFSQKIDIGKMNEKYFINIAGGGSLTELTYEVPSRVKTAIGPMAYYLKGMEKLANVKPFDVEIDIDGRVLKEKIVLFLVANTNSVGGFEKLAPNADSTDGLFDVFILKEVSIAKFTQLMGKLLSGEHVTDSKIMHFQTSKVSIRTKEKMGINLDGELGGATPAVFEVLQQHVECIVNKNKFL